MASFGGQAHPRVGTAVVAGRVSAAGVADEWEMVDFDLTAFRDNEEHEVFQGWRESRDD